MQVLILYYSRTGRTKKLAEAIGEGVQEVEGVTSLLKSAEEVTREDFVSSGGIIAGSPVYFGTMAAELKSVFDGFVGIRNKMEDKIGAAFATSNNPTGGKETTMISIIQAFLIYGMIVAGDPIKAGGHYGVAFSGEMSQKSVEDARKLGARVARLVKKMG